MSKFIELTNLDGTKGHFNVDNISCYFWDDKNKETKVFMNDSISDYFVTEKPAEIMAKIREVQNT